MTQPPILPQGTDEPQRLDTWGILEVMGHRKYAGRITEQVIAGAALVRVDVPEGVTSCGDPVPAFTKMVGAQSIYCLTPTTEDVARRAAAVLARWENTSPIPVDLPRQLPATPRAPVDAVDDFADAEWEDDQGGGDEDGEHGHALQHSSEPPDAHDEKSLGATGELLTRDEAFDLVQRALVQLTAVERDVVTGDAVRRMVRGLLGRDSKTLSEALFARVLRDMDASEVIHLQAVDEELTSVALRARTPDLDQFDQVAQF